MLRKILQWLGSCRSFWKGFLSAHNKKDYLHGNSSSVKTQVIIILVGFLICYVCYQAVKPAMKGVCRLVLQTEEDFPNLMGRVIGIEAKRAWLGTTQREVKAIGVLKSNAEVVIRTELPTGKISEILFTEGTEVTKGQVLIKFEDSYYLSEKSKYEAEYIMRKGEFERAKKLYSQKAGTQKTYDEALAGVTSAKAQLDSAAFQLSKTVIKAPFTGTIGILKGSVTPGNIVQQNTELVNIVDNSVVKIDFTVPVKYIEDIAVGQVVEISVDAFKGRTFSGTVEAIDSEVDMRNHSILVRAVIQNRSSALRHGMFANVKLVTGEKSEVVLIDEDALDREGSIEFVWVIDEKGRAYRKRVLTGAKDESGVEVLAGLKEGEIVVITGQLKLTDGSITKILNKKEFDEDAESFDNETTSSNEGDSGENSKSDVSDDNADEDGKEEKKEEGGDSEPTDDDNDDDKLKDSESSDSADEDGKVSKDEEGDAKKDKEKGKGTK